MLELLSYGDSGWGDEIIAGLSVTLSLALATLPFGLLAGFFIALAQNSQDATLRAAANIYTTVFRGLPELLTLFIVFYGLPLFLNAVYGLFHPAPDLQINNFLAGMLALGTVFSAYAAEVFQSAFRGIAKGQYEAGTSLGLSWIRTMRFVIVPQLLRLALPGLSNLWLILLKETALVSAIGLPDLLRQTGIAARVSKEAFLFFGVACLFYLLLSILSSFAIGYIERFTQRGEKI
ncbi:MAG: ABC transporter permease subunit [Proteobacteria bacterium]|nr:ABC transporter permease subunit [Pseudomonadota bacterium]MCH9758324.1 ABC transporter permease subunit [Pseudomonadota bacterium]